jgi:hypothetical protein
VTDGAGNVATAPSAYTQAVDTVAPTFSSSTTATFVEKGTAAAYDAQTTEGDTGMTYTLNGGVDANFFNINATTGAVTFKAAPNFFLPQDNGNNNVYDFTVRATDLAGNATDRAVALTVSNQPVLDTLGNSGAASYSLRLLDADYADKATKAIRVRRSSDNTEADIGFTASGDLDTAALLAHVGSGSGFVTTWYDQSGNGRNATQTTAGSQPRIVNNGVVEAINGKPEIRFDGVDDYLAAASPLIDTTHSLFVLFTPTIENVTGSLFGQWSAGQTGRFAILANQISSGGASAGFLNVFNGSATGGGGSGGLAAEVAISNTPTLITSISTTGSEQWKLFKNGTEWDSATIPSVYTGVNSAIGSLNGAGSSLPFDGTVSGLISFPSVLSTTDRQTLERNEGAYYGITVA